MNGVLDYSLVGLVLLISASYAVSSLGPRSLRRRMLKTLGWMLEHAPSFLGLRRLSQRLAVASAGTAQGACGGCETCGSEQAQMPGSAPTSPAAEVRVPVGKIGRRGKVGRIPNF